MIKLPKCLLVVSAEIDPAVEKEWNEWYNNIHLPEIVQCPGFSQAARYVSDSNGGRKYLAIYELESEDAVKSVEFKERRGWGQFSIKVKASVHVFKQIINMESSREKIK